MADIGILQAAVYVPAARLPRAVIAQAHAWANPALKALAKGRRSFAGWDEDAITMAVAAARACLAQGAGASIARLVFATTTAPFQDRANAVLIAEALGLDASVAAIESTGSLRAATAALREALAQGERASLLLAADRRPAKPASPQEIKYGDGAVALMLGAGKVLARYLGGSGLNADMVDHYRTGRTHGDYALEARWLREAGLGAILPPVIAAALADAGLEAAAIDHVVAPFAPAMLGKALAKADMDGAALADTLFDDIGDSGTPHALVMLCQALARARPGEKLLLLGFGQGADALIFEATDEVGRRSPADIAALPTRTDDNYLKFLSFNNEIRLDWGMRAERDNRTALPAFYRKRQAITGFTGGRCRQCGTPQFPKARACVDCGAIDSQEDYDFSHRLGRIKTFTRDWQAHTLSPPLVYGNIAFDGGGNLFMELTDCDGAELAVGMPVRMVFRIKDFDDRRGFRRYFWKAVPMHADTGARHG